MHAITQAVCEGGAVCDKRVPSSRLHCICHTTILQPSPEFKAWPWARSSYTSAVLSTQTCPSNSSRSALVHNQKSSAPTSVTNSPRTPSLIFSIAKTHR